MVAGRSTRALGTMKIAPETSAAIAYLLPAAAVAGIWIILLFVGNAPQSGPSDMLRYALREAPERYIFWWMALLPILYLALSAAYFSSVARIRNVAIALCLVGVILSAATWLTMDWTIALFATLPLLFTVPRAKAWYLTTRSSGP